MIPIRPRPEPSEFDRLVRQPGSKFLDSHGLPRKASEFRPYWKKIREELGRQYGNICAYTCIYLAGAGTVDHFLPKMQFPRLAYEWTNYRLASERANQRKSEHRDVLDPFRIAPHSFALEFPSCLVVPGPELPADHAPIAESTIDLLKLNDDDSLVQDRCDIIMLFRDRTVDFRFLELRYPFIAAELTRQDLVERIESIFKTR